MHREVRILAEENMMGSRKASDTWQQMMLLVAAYLKNWEWLRANMAASWPPSLPENLAAMKAGKRTERLSFETSWKLNWIPAMSISGKSKVLELTFAVPTQTLKPLKPLKNQLPACQ